MVPADATEFIRRPLPARLCNLDRLLYAMERRGIDGIVATLPYNVFYLSGLNGAAHKADEPRPYAVILSRLAPTRPILVVADYYLATFLSQPTWIEDVRPYRAVMMPLDLAARREDIDRFIPEGAQNIPWVQKARAAYSFDMGEAIVGGVRDLGLNPGRVAFDDMGVGFRLGLDGIEVADGYDPLMFARAVKTEGELDLLRRSTRLNEQAIRRTMAAWHKGATWRDLNRAYSRAVVELGGFVRDPGGMVWGHPRGADASLHLHSGLDDGEVTEGTHVMFDCHGTLDLYCWDGGKTWVVDGEPEGAAKLYAKATAAVAEALIDAMRPGMRVSALQTLARKVYAKSGVPDPDAALIFFHGLGLSHMELEQKTADGQPNGDWMLEEGMVAPMHLLYPGGERERLWLEEVVHVTKDGGRPLFAWGFEPLTGR